MYLSTVRQSLAQKLPRAHDPTFYPVDDDMAEGVLHRHIAELLRSLLQRWLVETGQIAFAGANTFIYWAQFHPEICVAPDVYVMPGVRPDAAPDNWKLWESGAVPSLVVEIVSKHPKKDYATIHEKYADLGVPEVIIFDPKAGRARSKRVRWQVYRRRSRGGFARVEVSNEDRVRSRSLGCWLRAAGAGGELRVRVATGATGDDLFPTEAEAERRARAEAEAEIARLRAQLARLEGRRAQ